MGRRTSLLCFLLLAGCASAPAYYEKARTYEKQGDFTRALSMIERAAARDARNAEYHMLKGYYLSRLGRTEEAAAAYKRSYELKPEPHVAYCLAEILAADGRYIEAEPYAVRVVYHNSGFVPGLKLLCEVELALWKLDHARQCLDALDYLNAEAGALKRELARRRRVKPEARPAAGGLKNYCYFKAGTILTGLPGAGKSVPGEPLLTVLNTEELADILGRMLATAQAFRVPVRYVTSFPASGGNMITSLLVRTAGAREVKDGTDITGRPVWICMENYDTEGDLARRAARIKARGGRPYVFSLGVSRSALRAAAAAPPDIGGVGGSVYLDERRINVEDAVRRVKQFLRGEAASYRRAQLRFYSGDRGDVRIREKR